MGTTWCYFVNMRGLSLACVILCAGLVLGQDSTESSPEDNVTTSSPVPSTTTTEAPVVIVKQVNEINEDGSYTVGYEASDGSFRLETKDAEGNVEGKYGVVDENGEIKIVEYSANNSTGFQSDLEIPVPEAQEGGAAPVQQADPAFELEKQRHAAVLAFQKAVIEKQQLIAQKNDASAQRQNFANNRQGPRRPVFNAANFDPNRPASQQFNTQNFNRDFRDFQQRQQFSQQQPQQFAQQQPQQFAQQQPSQFNTQFNQNQQFAQNPQQFAPQQPQPAQQFVPRQQQFAPQQQQQFAQQPQQFAPQQQQQFAPQQPQQIPLSQLTREDIALQGFSRDDDQDGQIDPLPAHLQPAQQQQQFFQPQQPQQQQFIQQQQQPAFQQQPQQSFRTPQPVQPSPVSQQQFSQAQLQQLFAQQQQQQQQF